MTLLDQHSFLAHLWRACALNELLQWCSRADVDGSYAWTEVYPTGSYRPRTEVILHANPSPLSKYVRIYAMKLRYTCVKKSN